MLQRSLKLTHLDIISLKIFEANSKKTVSIRLEYGDNNEERETIHMINKKKKERIYYVFINFRC